MKENRPQPERGTMVSGSDPSGMRDPSHHQENHQNSVEMLVESEEDLERITGGRICPSFVRFPLRTHWYLGGAFSRTSKRRRIQGLKGVDCSGYFDAPPNSYSRRFLFRNEGLIPSFWEFCEKMALSS